MANINGNEILFGAAIYGSGVGSGNYVPHMSAIDANRIKSYEEDGGYYFSENNWNKFIGENNRVYVERSNDRGTYGMYALSYNDNPIYNAWYSKSQWEKDFAQKHPGETFREPYDNEYPVLDSVVQRLNSGQIVVPLEPTEDRFAASRYFVNALIGSVNAKLTELTNELDNIKLDIYTGTDGLTYSLSSNGKYYICTGLGTVPTNSDIEIAAFYGGLPVTEIGAGAFNGKTIKSIIIPTTITKFGDSAFGWSGPVDKVYVKDLAKWASIAFEGSASPVTTANKGIYIKGRYLTELVIPEGVTQINRRAFMHWTQFKSLVLPSTVTFIDEMAFQYCRGLENVVIPASVQSILGQAFGLCTALKTVTFKGKPSEINGAAFYNDTALTDIYVPWSEGEVSGADVKWGATNATIHYNSEV